MSLQEKIKELLLSKSAHTFVAYNGVVRLRFGLVDLVFSPDRMVFVSAPNASLIIADDTKGKSLRDIAADQYTRAIRLMYSDRYTDDLSDLIQQAIDKEIQR